MAADDVNAKFNAAMDDFGAEVKERVAAAEVSDVSGGEPGHTDPVRLVLMDERHVRKVAEVVVTAVVLVCATGFLATCAVVYFSR